MLFGISRTTKPRIIQIFRRFNALELIDDYYEIPTEVNISFPSNCPICNKFIDNKNEKCQYVSLPNICPLEVYNKNKNIIDSLIEELEKKNR